MRLAAVVLPCDLVVYTKDLLLAVRSFHAGWEGNRPLVVEVAVGGEKILMKCSKINQKKDILIEFECIWVGFAPVCIEGVVAGVVQEDEADGKPKRDTRRVEEELPPTAVLVLIRRERCDRAQTRWLPRVCRVLRHSCWDGRVCTDACRLHTRVRLWWVQLSVRRKLCSSLRREKCLTPLCNRMFHRQ